jgi:hypothetical protein
VEVSVVRAGLISLFISCEYIQVVKTGVWLEGVYGTRLTSRHSITKDVIWSMEMVVDSKNLVTKQRLVNSIGCALPLACQLRRDGN